MKYNTRLALFQKNKIKYIKKIFVFLLLLSPVFLALFVTAWICDDAFITMRVIDNFLNGYGLRWNISERVQVFTHPLWILSLIPFVYITNDFFIHVIFFL